MKKKFYLLTLTIFTLLYQNNVFGQMFLNGGFETTTGNCDYNLPNSTFNSLMGDCIAFGNASQIDIINSSCGFGSAQEGNFFIGLAVDITNTQTDALSIKLASPLAAGNTCNLTFYNKSDPAFGTNLLEIGYSADSISFGTAIDTAALPTTAWDLVSFTFTPEFSTQFITVRAILGTYGWNHVDDFEITTITGTNSFSQAKQTITVFPNPTSDFISIYSYPLSQFKTIFIKDLAGKIILTTSNTKIDLRQLECGIYIVEIVTDQEKHTARIFRK